MKLKKTLFTLTMLFISAQWVFSFNGSGTDSSPYLIENASDWTTFANNVTSGQSYSGKYFKMTADIRTDVMVGKYKSENEAFKGTFDGNGHTICFVFTESGYNDYDIAPFRSINGATIKNLHTTGVITIGSYDNNHAAGIACRTYGNCTISSCRSDISINGMGGGVYGGIVSTSCLAPSQ